MRARACPARAMIHNPNFHTQKGTDMNNTPDRAHAGDELGRALDDTLDALERAAAPENAAEAEHREKEAYERGETVQSFDSTMELEDAMREAQRRARARMDERRKKSAREADREARATQYSYAERAEAAMARPRKKKRGPLAAMGAVAGALAVLLAVLCVASSALYSRYDPERFVADVLAALEGGDAAALAGHLVSDEVTVNEENAALLCAAFSGADAREALASQLRAQSADPAAAGAYEALGVEKDPVFLGFCEYRIRVRGAQLMLRTNAQNVLLSLNGATRTGEEADGGILYKNLFPGRYSCTVTGATPLGEQLTGAETQLDLFSVSAPFEFDGALPIADVTVSGAVSDEAVIFINGTEVANRPSGGVVQLPQVAVGSTISFQYTEAHGAVTTGSVVFSDRSATQLAFGDIQTTGDTPDEAAINTLLSAYYASFVNAVNNKDASLVTGASAAQSAALPGLLEAEAFKDKVLQFTSAVVKADSVAACEVNGAPAFRCNAAMAYHTRSSTGDGAEADAMLYENVEFVFENGAWAVNRTVTIDEAKYTANDLSALEAPAA